LNFTKKVIEDFGWNYNGIDEAKFAPEFNKYKSADGTAPVYQLKPLLKTVIEYFGDQL